MTEKLHVGQKLFYVDSQARYHPFTDVVVVSIGRKWAQLDNRLKINLETLWADGGQYSSPGRCYLSREDYEAEKEANAAWQDFVNRLSRAAPPRGMTADAIDNLRPMFGLPERKKP